MYSIKKSNQSIKNQSISQSVSQSINQYDKWFNVLLTGVVSAAERSDAFAASSCSFASSASPRLSTAIARKTFSKISDGRWRIPHRRTFIAKLRSDYIVYTGACSDNATHIRRFSRLIILTLDLGFDLQITATLYGASACPFLNAALTRKLLNLESLNLVDMMFFYYCLTRRFFRGLQNVHRRHHKCLTYASQTGCKTTVWNKSNAEDCWAY